MRCGGHKQGPDRHQASAPEFEFAKLVQQQQGWGWQVAQALGPSLNLLGRAGFEEIGRIQRLVAHGPWQLEVASDDAQPVFTRALVGRGAVAGNRQHTFDPLATGDDVPLFILNVTRVIDALDEDRADVLRFPDGRIAYLNAPAFHADKVRDVDFFKLAGRRSEIFVGERFVARVREAKLVGLEFSPVWSPAGGPIRRRLI